jgi:translocation and assembly module TamB
MRRLNGTLDAHVNALGPLQDPVIEGTVDLRSGTADAWRLPTLSNITLQANIASSQVTLKNLSANVGTNGSLVASGTAGLQGYKPYDGSLALTVKSVPLPIRGLSDLRFSGVANATLKTVGKRMKLAATLKDGYVDLPAIQIPKSLRSSGPLQDVHFVGVTPLETEAETSAAPEFDLDLDVEPLRVRGKDIDITATSKLGIESDAGETRMTGNVTLTRGSVNLFNRLWDVERARMMFGGTFNPGIDVSLTRQFSSAFVTLRVQGTLSKPELVLLSDPPLDRAQIVSLVVTGSAGSKASETGTAIAAAALTQLFGGFTNDLVSKIGIDVLRIDMDNSNTRLELGKYLGERVYVGYRRLLGAAGDDRNGNELRLEYRLTDRLMLESGFGDAGIGGLELVWTYRY